MLRFFKSYWLFVAGGILIPVSSLIWPDTRSIVGPMKFHENIGLSSISQMLIILLLITVFLERALEVFVLTFRAPGEDNYADNAEKLAEYKHETRRITLSSALFMGILISMIGIRGIGAFIDFQENTIPWQRAWFHILDILLTGGVIAGGSNFIHKMLQIITTFMDAVTAAQKSTEAASNANIATARSQEIKSQVEVAKANQTLNQVGGDTLGDTLQDT
jgi:F0F1-type ATP synthase assembly protein I